MKTVRFRMMLALMIAALLCSGGQAALARASDPYLGDGPDQDPESALEYKIYHPIIIKGGSAVQLAKVAAGSEFTCAVTLTGGARCWGYNYYGQLGDGGSDLHTTPVNVSGLTSGVKGVAAGASHACALTTSGSVWCWGWNTYGQIGDGTTTDRHAPVAVAGLTGATMVVAGYIHSCALTTSGGVKCWGGNHSGQLGDGTTTDRLTPVDVLGVSGALAIVSGAYHTCVLTATRGIQCWGENEDGQLGDGTMTERHAPVDVSGLSEVQGVYADSKGHHTCAVTGTGGVKCWGYNEFGQLGDGTTTNQAAPVDISGLDGVTDMALGFSHTCAGTSTGGAKCWGSNSMGTLGDGTTVDRLAPVEVAGLVGATGIAAGNFHTCAAIADGDVMCWGWNHSGQLGDGTTTQRNTPVSVVGFPGQTGY